MRLNPPASAIPPALSHVFLIAALLLPLPVFSQVAIYDLSFQALEEHSINFPAFDGGYLALDLVTGKGSFIFTFKDNSEGVMQPCFVQATEAAQAFTAVRNAERKTVIRATAQTNTAIGHYLATGTVNREISVPSVAADPKEPVKVASILFGQVLASDDESDVDFPAGHTLIGFAGMASFDLTLNPDLTDRANRRQETLSQAIQGLVGQLKRLSFQESLPHGE
jgi:hypothetical protein